MNLDNNLNTPSTLRYRTSFLLGGVGVVALIFVFIFALLGANPSEADQRSYMGQQAAQGVLATGTLDVLLSTFIPDPDARATVDAAIEDEINSAIISTLIALTPTATPLPTDVPIQDTFV
ncbi:MAG: hypothetical protein CUN55_14955, partial [Phototrophicales bacterium]